MLFYVISSTYIGHYHPSPWVSYGGFKIFKISASDFSTVGMRRRFLTCAYKFPTMVTKGVVK